MRYLFFDLEYASSKNRSIKICEFGYVVTDEFFEIIERGNIIINPDISRREWDWFAVKKILTRKVSEYESHAKFKKFYSQIKRVIYNSEYVFGHTINGDVKALNDECKRYNYPSLNFEFYDVKEIYKKHKHINSDVSLSNIMSDLNIVGSTPEHDAEIDALNTMLCLKEILKKQKICLRNLLEKYSDLRDYNENYLVDSIENPRINLNKIEEILKGNSNNSMVKGSLALKIFCMFLDNVSPNTNEEKTMGGYVVSITENYETSHYRQMLNIVQLLVNKGAKYVCRIKQCNMLVSYPSDKEEERLKYANKLNKEGKNIKIINFSELLEMLGLYEEELDDLPLVSFDCLFKDDVIIRNQKLKKYFNKNNRRLIDIK